MVTGFKYPRVSLLKEDNVVVVYYNNANNIGYTILNNLGLSVQAH